MPPAVPPPRDPRTPNPVVNLVAWVIAIGILVAVVVTGGGRLWGIVTSVLTAPTPLVGRIAVGVGLGVAALFLLLFFGWLLLVLLRAAIAPLQDPPREHRPPRGRGR